MPWRYSFGRRQSESSTVTIVSSGGATSQVRASSRTAALRLDPFPGISPATSAWALCPSHRNCGRTTGRRAAAFSSPAASFASIASSTPYLIRAPGWLASTVRVSLRRARDSL